jgi:hypothetical protein
MKLDELVEMAVDLSILVLTFVIIVISLGIAAAVLFAVYKLLTSV